MMNCLTGNNRDEIALSLRGRRDRYIDPPRLHRGVDGYQINRLCIYDATAAVCLIQQ